MLCAAVVGMEVQFAVIFANGAGHMICQPLLSATLSTLEGRAAALRIIINIARIIVTQQRRGKIPYVSQKEYMDLTRSHGVILKFQRDTVRKTFPRDHPRLEGVMAMWAFLQQRQAAGDPVPHTPHVISLHQRDAGLQVTMSPRGVEQTRWSLKSADLDLPCAIVAVLEALDALHRAGWVHRDVRWPNLLKVSPGVWLLIDFERARRVDAAGWEQGRDGLFRVAPDGYQTEPWTPAFDLWQVGRLLPDAADHPWFGLRTLLVSQLQAGNPTVSATDALVLARALKDADHAALSGNATGVSATEQ